MVVKPPIIKDAEYCVKPILEVLENVLIPSTAHDRKKEIRFEMAKLSDATSESRKRYELKCEYLRQQEQLRLFRECLSIIDKWNLNPNKLDAWIKLSNDYDFFQSELKEFKSIFREEFSMPSKTILTFSTHTSLDIPKVREGLKNLHSCLVSQGKLNGKATSFQRFRSLFAGREIEKINWIGDIGSCIELIRTLIKSSKLSIPKSQKKHEILTRFFECKGKSFDENQFYHGKATPKNYSPIQPFVDEFLDALS
jgi:hypothetical protein